jgi:hypothetical protein
MKNICPSNTSPQAPALWAPRSIPAHVLQKNHVLFRCRTRMHQTEHGEGGISCPQDVALETSVSYTGNWRWLFAVRCMRQTKCFFIRTLTPRISGSLQHFPVHRKDQYNPVCINFLIFSPWNQTNRRLWYQGIHLMSWIYTQILNSNQNSWGSGFAVKDIIRDTIPPSLVASSSRLAHICTTACNAHFLFLNIRLYSKILHKSCTALYCLYTVLRR